MPKNIAYDLPCEAPGRGHLPGNPVVEVAWKSEFMGLGPVYVIYADGTKKNFLDGQAWEGPGSEGKFHAAWMQYADAEDVAARLGARFSTH